MSIEHILPRKWLAHWDDTAGDVDAMEEKDRAVHTLGNLTLVTKKLNSKLSNSPWVDAKTGQGKRSALDRHSTLLMTQRVVETHPTSWSRRDIDERTKEMVGLIIEAWPRPVMPHSKVL